MPTTYEQDVQGNLIAQYQESPVLISFFEALASEADVLGNAAIGTIEGRTLNGAVGVQLDIIGSLVGASRIVTDAILIEFFGYDPDPTSLGFSDLGDPAVGGRYRSADESTISTRRLSDADYRVYILGTIYKNITRVTGNQVLEATIRLFELIDGVAPLVTVEDGDMYYYVFVGRVMSENDKLLIQALDLLPKTLGVRSFYVSYNPGESGDPNAPEGYFGFSQDPDALGFGSIKYNDFSAAPFSPFNGCTVDVNTDIAPDGTQTADRVNDTSNTQAQGLQIDATNTWNIDKTKPITVSVYIEKNSIPKTQYYAMLGLYFFGNTQEYLSLRIDTSTGEIISNTAGAIEAIGAEVVDRGTYWQLYASARTVDPLQNYCGIEFYPCLGAYDGVDWVDDPTLIGSNVYWGAQYYLSQDYPELYNDFAALDVRGTDVVQSDTDTAPDGTQTADTLTDNDPTAYEFVNIDAVAEFSNPDQPMVTRIYVKKDAVPKTTRYPILRFLWHDGGENQGRYAFADLRLDTSTGEIDSVSGSDASPETSAPTVIASSVYDAGDYWELVLLASIDSATWAVLGSVLVSYYPAVGNYTTDWAYNSAISGSTVNWGLSVWQSPAQGFNNGGEFATLFST